MSRKQVAIVGMAFRLPGTTPDRFWSDLLAGRNLVTEVAADRWAQESYWHPRKSHPGTSYTFAAGSIGDVYGFDAGFFGISPREAAQTDPQQRLLLELAWEALENAGVRPSAVRGSQCGVYVGIAAVDYAFRFADNLGAIDSSVATGTSNSIAANRISYAFDLRGPSIAVDTACSSSLVAFHLACRSIVTGDSTHALAGGVSVHTHPYGFIAFSKASMLSRRGACSVFDAAGDGYVRSEGAGLFYLKDYDLAMADGDRILAVVAGSAINADGRKSGLTVPSAQAQAALLTKTYAEAGIDPAAIDYLEAHGTGTAVGDPVETQALGEALGRRRPRGNPLLIGSVKSNTGHLEAASGVAGLVKAVHCIQHRMVPATIHLDNPNPSIHFDEWNIRAVTAAVALKPAGRVIVGVNSFGFGGANAHVILASPEPQARAAEHVLVNATLPLVVSGKSADALKDAARDLAGFLRRDQPVPFYDVAWSAAFHHDWHEHRAVVLADNAQAAAQSLDAFAEGVTAAGRMECGVALAQPTALAFVYSGNGSQWEGMGRRLLAQEPLFRDAVRAVDAIFRPLAGFSLEAELAGGNGSGRYEDTEVAQPALFAMQVGITEVLRSRGVEPAAVTGHSVGEVAAAWAAGALTLEQAVRVIYHRSKLQGMTKGCGQMTAVALGESAIVELIESLNLARALTIAGINSSDSVTVAGETSALDLLEVALGQRDLSFKRLDLDYAFHSPAMDSLEAGILEALGDLRPGAAVVAFHSAVTGEQLDGTALGPAYWWRNIREPVCFEKAIKSILADGVTAFVEVGPHALLRRYLVTCMHDAGVQGQVVPTVLRDDDASDRLWSALCQVMIVGASIDWSKLFPARGAFVQLPNYAWQRERHLHTLSPESGLHRHREHPLLGYRLHEVEWAWENQIDTQLNPSFADHVIGDAIVMPGTAFAEMALAAGRLWHGGDQVEIEQLEIRSPLVLAESQSKVVRFVIDPTDGGFTIRSRDHGTEEAWTLHATGRIIEEPHDILGPQAPLTLPTRPADTNGDEHRMLTGAVGLDYGPAFRALESIWVEDGSVCATFHIPHAIESELAAFDLHPALLDCAFQLIIQLLKEDYLTQSGAVYVPAKIVGLHFRTGKGTPHSARATLLKCSPYSITAAFTLYDAAGERLAWIREARFSSIRLRKNPADRLRYIDYHCIPHPHPLESAAAPHRLFEQLHARLTDVAHLAVRSGTLQRYTAEIEPLLDTLCGRFAADALKALAADGQVLRQADVAACANADPETAGLLARLIGIAQEDKAMTSAGQEWHFAADEDHPSAQDIWNGLIADYPDFLPVLHGVGRVGMHLADLLRGRCRLEQLLPRECTPSRLMRLLLAEAGLSAIVRALQDLVPHGLAQLPTGKRLRIVEIGAGSPTFAVNLCKALDFDRCDYVFATTVPETVEDCHSLLEAFPGVAVRQIGVDAPDAGVIPPNEQFHLALVTADFATGQETAVALAWVKRRLAAGGAVLVVEQHPSRWMDLVFGGRRDWWIDASGSHWSSHYRPAAFRLKQMQTLGYQSAAVLELSADGGSGPYLLFAQETDHAGTVSPAAAAAARTWVLLTDKEGFAARFTDAMTRTLEAHGDRVVQVTPGSRHQRLAGDSGGDPMNAFDEGQLESLFRELGPAGQVAGILHLHGLREPSRDATPTLLLEQQIDRCVSAATVTKVCAAAGTRSTLWLVTARATTVELSAEVNLAAGTDAALWGFGRTLMNEASDLSVRLVDIDAAAALDTIVATLVREIAHPDAEQEIILTASGDRYVPRLRVEPAASRPPAPDAVTDASTLRLGLQFPGQLRNLRWELHPRTRPGSDELEVAVHATGLNFRDVMYALGLLTDEVIEGGFAGPTLGLEFAGVVTGIGSQVRGFALGDRVVGFGPMSFATRVVTPAVCVYPIPADLSFAAAATIPSTFFTVYYSLNHLARLAKGEKILIHGAAGGVGIAAIQVAKHCGAEIFATAGSDEKRDFLRLLGVPHVLDSRSLAYADAILAITEGKGVDVVLNSLAGEAINRNLRVLKPFGRFLELGKRDFQENTRIGLRPFRNNISYFGIDADQLMKERPDLTEQIFREMIALFNDGVLHPLPYRCFEAGQIVDAFRHMQQSRQIGKIVITYRDGVQPTHGGQPERGRLELPAAATYLVTGGLSGFGLKTAQWLAARGASHLVLVSRSGPVTDEARAGIAQLEAAGVIVRAAACDITDREALAALLSEIAVVMPPLRGIVHAAAVYEDGLARNLTREQIRRVLAPKMLGAYYLHQLTLAMDLDLFILFSSATTLFGNPGQSNYVAANAAIEALAASRRAARLPALCVRWGAIDDAGYLARNTQIKEALQNRMGGAAIPSAVALEALEELVLADRSGLGVMELDWRALSRFLPTARSPKFSDLAQNVDDIAAAEDSSGDLRRMVATLPAQALEAAVADMLKKEVGDILRIAPDKIDEHRSLYDMGFDSLMGVELTTAVEARFTVRLPVMAISESPTVAKLSARILAQLTSADQDGDELDDHMRQVATRYADDEHAETYAKVAEDLRSGGLTTTTRMIQ